MYLLGPPSDTVWYRKAYTYLVSALVTNFDMLPATRISCNYISDVEGYRLRLKQSILIPDALILLYTNLSSLPVFSSYFRITTPVKSMEALSTEWRSGVQYALGDRVAFKITGSLGLAAFECLQIHISSSDKQPIAGGNSFWKHYPRGFPRRW